MMDQLDTETAPGPVVRRRVSTAVPSAGPGLGSSIGCASPNRASRVTGRRSRLAQRLPRPPAVRVALRQPGASAPRRTGPSCAAPPTPGSRAHAGTAPACTPSGRPCRGPGSPRAGQTRRGWRRHAPRARRRSRTERSASCVRRSPTSRPRQCLRSGVAWTRWLRPIARRRRRRAPTRRVHGPPGSPQRRRRTRRYAPHQPAGRRSTVRPRYRSCRRAPRR